jgi:integrase
MDVERFRLLLPAGQEEKVREEFEDVIASELRNPHTLSAYLYAWRNFSDWCAAAGVEPLNARPAHIGVWITGHKGSPRTQRQHLSAVRRLFDIYLVAGVIERNPALRVKAPKFSDRRSRTEILEPDEASDLLSSLEEDSLLGQRNLAIVRVMFHHAVRVGAIVRLEVRDYFLKEGYRWLVFGEKRGKVHELAVHPKAERALNIWLGNSELADRLDWPLFPAFDRDRETLLRRPVSRRSLYKLMRRFAANVGIGKKIGCHSFRATAITFFRKNGGSLEDACRLANHASPVTTMLYDRTFDEALRKEVLRVDIPRPS